MGLVFLRYEEIKNKNKQVSNNFNKVRLSSTETPTFEENNWHSMKFPANNIKRCTKFLTFNGKITPYLKSNLYKFATNILPKGCLRKPSIRNYK
jgi:hypothetical protein